MTHLAKVTAEMRAIPASKWRYKLGKFVIALGIGALFYFVALPQQWPMAVQLTLAVAIGYCISPDVMKAIVKFIVAGLRDVFAAIGGKGNGNAPPPSSPVSPPA